MKGIPPSSGSKRPSRPSKAGYTLEIERLIVDPAKTIELNKNTRIESVKPGQVAFHKEESAGTAVSLFVKSRRVDTKKKSIRVVFELDADVAAAKEPNYSVFAHVGNRKGTTGEDVRGVLVRGKEKNKYLAVIDINIDGLRYKDVYKHSPGNFIVSELRVAADRNYSGTVTFRNMRIEQK
jgi:hypothetical protein